MESEYEESERLHGNLPCDSCGSSDAVSAYSDGHTFCFSCNALTNDGEKGEKKERVVAADLITDGYYTTLHSRKISERTCRIYDYQLGDHWGGKVQIANYRNSEGTIVAQKLRDANKDFNFIGNPKEAQLFGQHLFNGGRKLVITEGEIDCLSLAEIYNCKWPVVSIAKGAKSAKKEIKENLDFLLKFDLVIFMFDMDDAGREAAKECVKILPPNRAATASLPLKDINECLVAGQGTAVERAVWDAKVYKPEKIVGGEEIWTRMLNRPDVTCYPYPDDIMPLMNEKTYGIRLGELDVWTSGSGMGKTTVIKQLQLHFQKTTDLNQALLHLEEPLEDTADHMIGMAMEKRISLPDVEVDENEKRKVFESLFLSKDKEGALRMQLYDSFGSEEEDELVNVIRYYANGLDCKVFWLDHLSILVSDMGIEGDERRKIDSIMHTLKSLTQELGIYIGLIVHLRKPSGNGKSFEEGGVPSLDDLRGSGGIKQLSNGVYAVSRDQQDTNPVAADTSLLTVLKCRFTGRTGNADYVLFDQQKGILKKGFKPDGDDDFIEEF